MRHGLIVAQQVMDVVVVNFVDRHNNAGAQQALAFLQQPDNQNDAVLSTGVVPVVGART